MRLAASLLALGLVATACSAGEEGGDEATEDNGTDPGAQEDGTSVLQQVTDRGELVCGVNDAVPGFGVTDADGNFSGFDIDFCRAIAAAVLGDADAVSFVPLTAQQRFTTLQSGEIDVLVRNTTWTATRDGTEGAAFATTTFYDGQGMMVNADSGISSVDELDGATICVLSGTTTELNLETRFASAGLEYTPAAFEDNDTLQEAFTQGQCDAWTSDKSQLAGVRSAWPEGPEALTILEETFSKEPLGPAVRDGDPDWYDAVNWAVIATIQAEEFGIDSTNVDSMRDSDDPSIAGILGSGDISPGLGLPDDFAYQVISQVGNYAEIYDRNVGPDTGLGLERGLNALYTDGGILYPPPYR
jgi:general L-amino acid transport system substrate-binding protein